MSSIISLDSVSCQLGNKQLFDQLKLVVSDDSKLAIIGPNGSGKSSLMKVMAGILPVDSGRVVVTRGTQIAYVQQIDNFKDNASVKETIVSELLPHYSKEESEVRAAKFLTQANFKDPDAKISSLSGGWRKRLALASALAQEPQLLLLDEPTNHLDLSGLFWLEELLKNANFAWVLISHDRYFLERTANEVMEISPYYKNGMLKFDGSYNNFVQKREEYLEQEARSTAALANKYRIEADWASRSPKARTTKASFRLKEVDKLNQELRERKSRIPTKTAEVTFTSSGRQTRELVELINTSIAFAEKQILNKVNLTIRSGNCLGILGTNGQGKSTLLKLIGGALQPDAGKVKQAAFLKTVYFDQLRSSLKSASTLGEALSEGSEQVVYQDKLLHVVSWAKRFGFTPDDFIKPLSALSGGEQARVLLSILVRQEADLLILDEPTNDLDIPMLEALEIMLSEFEGGVVLVTHDRFMLENVCTNYLGFNLDGELLPYASYQQWEELRKSNGASVSVVNKTKQVKLKKIPDAERKELQQIEKKIVKAEQVLADIQERAGDPELHVNHEASSKIAAELKEAADKVDALYKRWEELEALQQS